MIFVYKYSMPFQTVDSVVNHIQLAQCRVYTLTIIYTCSHALFFHFYPHFQVICVLRALYVNTFEHKSVLPTPTPTHRNLIHFTLIFKANKTQTKHLQVIIFTDRSVHSDSMCLYYLYSFFLIILNSWF